MRFQIVRRVLQRACCSTSADARRRPLAAAEERRLSESAKKTVAYRQQYTCRICETVLPPSYEVDHITPLALGGSNGLGNLQALCPACHATKTRVDIADIAAAREEEHSPPPPLLWATEDDDAPSTRRREELSDLLATLNAEQAAAVKSESAAFKLKAGPGTGKTRVLTARAQLLVEERDVQPMSVLGLTFTNRAANEMRRRLEERLGSAVAQQLTLGTFHSVALRMLRQDIERLHVHDDAGEKAGPSLSPGSPLPNCVVAALKRAERSGWLDGDPLRELRGYTRSFVVFDGQDSQQVCARLVRDAAPEDASTLAGRLRPAAVQRAISYAKNCGIDARAFEALVELRGSELGAPHAATSLIGAAAIEAAFARAAERSRAAPSCLESAAAVASLLRAAHLAVGGAKAERSGEAAQAHRGVEWLGLELVQLRQLSTLFTMYEHSLVEQNALDYDDLLLIAGRLLREHSGGGVLSPARRKYRGVFRHILVDEYQDTNALQFELLRLLGRGAEEAGGAAALEEDALFQSESTAGRSLFVVGDADQAIYGWRGADVSGNEEKWARYFGTEGVEDAALRENYRAQSQVLLNACHALIAPNYPAAVRADSEPLVAAAALASRANVNTSSSTAGEKEDDDVWPTGGPVIGAAKLADQDGEARWVVERILEQHGLVGGGRESTTAVSPDATTAIVYRTNAQSRPFERELIRMGIPHKISNTTAFFERREVKDCIAFLRAVRHRDDVASLERIINVPPRGVGKGAWQSLSTIASAQPEEEAFVWNVSTIPDALEAIAEAHTYGEVNDILPRAAVSARAASALTSFHETIQTLRSSLRPGSEEEEGENNNPFFIGTARRFADAPRSESPHWDDASGREASSLEPQLPQFIRTVLQETGYEEWVRHGAGASDGIDRWGNLRELANLAAGYPASEYGLLHFLDEMALLGDTDAVLSAASEGGGRAGGESQTVSPADIPTVQLMTVHAAKGLEFETVFCVGFEEDLLPHFHSQEHKRDVAEERRLAYVAASRARANLRFTCARRRLLWGTPKMCEPSRFLTAIPSGLITPMGSY